MKLLSIFMIFTTFFAGYLIAPIIYKKNIKPILFYPIWITTNLKGFLNKNLKFYVIFLLILLFNSTSLFIILVSGLVPFLPFLFIFWLGINLGISIFHISEGRHYFLILLNPVAILEIAATVITGHISIKLSSKTQIINNLAISLSKKLNMALQNTVNSINNIKFILALRFFLYYIIPILIMAAIIETAMITLMQSKNLNRE